MKNDQQNRTFSSYFLLQDYHFSSTKKTQIDIDSKVISKNLWFTHQNSETLFVSKKRRRREGGSFELQMVVIDKREGRRRHWTSDNFYSDVVFMRPRIICQNCKNTQITVENDETAEIQIFLLQFNSVQYYKFLYAVILETVSNAITIELLKKEKKHSNPFLVIWNISEFTLKNECIILLLYLYPQD